MQPTKMQLTKVQRFALWLALAQSTISLVGSLIASEYMKLPPCDLCWWQRVCWYPLVVIFAVGIIRKETVSTFWTALTLSVIGWFFSLYQVVLQEGVMGEGIIPCSLDNPCGIKVSMFPAPLDIITIPMMSLAGFSLILACLAIVRWYRTPKA